MLEIRQTAKTEQIAQLDRQDGEPLTYYLCKISYHIDLFFVIQAQRYYFLEKSIHEIKKKL